MAMPKKPVQIAACPATYPHAAPAYIETATGFGVVRVKSDMERRAVMLAEYMIENRATVRSTAKQFGISKSTVHMAVTKRNGLYGA